DSGTGGKPQITPSKRAKSASKTKNSTSSTKSSMRSKISFGPRVGKLDFESALTTKTAIRQKESDEQGETKITNAISSSSMSTTCVQNQASTSTASPSISQFTSTNPLNVAEIREKLKGCKNLANLKQHLASINGCADKVKQIKTMKVPMLSPAK